MRLFHLAVRVHVILFVFEEEEVVVAEMFGLPENAIRLQNRNSPWQITRCALEEGKARE